MSMLKSSTIIEFLSIYSHISKSLCLIYFNAMFFGPLKFMEQTLTSLLIITFINIKWLSLLYWMHFALNFTLSAFHSAFLFLLVPIFLIYLCCRSNRAWRRWHFWGGMDETEFFISYFAPIPSLLQYNHGMGSGMGGKLPSLTQLL